MAATTLSQITDWIANASERHAKASETECVCGWTGIDVPWEKHRPYFPLADLQDIVPSNWRNSDGTTYSCAETIELLTEALDKAHSEVDAMRDALERIASVLADMEKSGSSSIRQ